MASVKCSFAARQLQSSARRVQCLQVAAFSTTGRRNEERSYKMLIVGGGAGGSSIANKFSSKFGKDLCVIEPSETHYYQPMWTMIGGGMKKFDQCHRETEDILPSKSVWLKDCVRSFDPDNNQVTTANGDKINYDMLVVALGIQLDYGKVKGLVEALEEDPAVCSNYHKDYVRKTFPAATSIQDGNAIFTFPNTPIKCAGAPQKIMYILDEYFNKEGKRGKINVIYNTALPVIFGIPKYAAALNEVVKLRGINVNLKHNLVEVRHKSREAVFENLDTGEQTTYQYNFLHAGAPCTPLDALKGSPLVDATNFVDVDKLNLQHKKYPNVFAIGDCSNAPTAKTAAAVAAQSGIVSRSIKEYMGGKNLSGQYNGYTSCPLVTGRGKCILAEFGYDGQVLETFPVNQGKERRTMYHMKKDVMPTLYWLMLVKGMWNGPGIFRKIFRPLG